MSVPLIEIASLYRYFGEGEGRVCVLDNINLTIKRGEFVAIVGQSGSGKSTLMNILGCLDKPTSGSYCIAGEETVNMDSDTLANLRQKRFGFIFQRYNLLSALNAEENVALPAIYAGKTKAERLRRARELLQKLGLETRAHHKPSELSGGQQQRVSIARALMNGGELILADEPTGALDSASGCNVMQIIHSLHQAGHTIILVTHDSKLAAEASRMIEIRDGRIIADVVRSDSETLLEQATLPAAPPEPIETLPETSNTTTLPAAKKTRRFSFKGRFLEAFSMSIQAVMSHKMRSLLTMLGIIIGIASVVSIVALGKGSQEKILANISAIGTNTISIFPGTGFGDRRAHRIHTLTVADADVLAEQSYVDSVTPVTNAQGLLTYRDENLSARLTGAGSGYFAVRGVKIDKGRLINKDDIDQSRSVVVIDYNTQQKLFANQNALGEVILFNRRPLTVVGVSAPEEGIFASQHGDALQLWAPFSTVMGKITGARYISAIAVKVKDGTNTQAADKSISDLIRARHGKQDFFTSNSDSIRQTVESTTGTLTLLISSIALISLLVGGIGVMNIMLVSVTERTREIGTRMAIGAREGDILQQFLIEAVLICLIGGLAGVLLSFLIALVFNSVVTDFAMTFAPASVVLAVLCSTAIGVLFGYMPARSAAKLNPIDALSRD